MNSVEEPLVMDCSGERMVGILHRPDQAGSRGILVIVGGPQYRIGSHRQFLALARHLARHGIPVLRFDYRGMGDSDGEQRTFENIAEDIRTALDEFFRRVPGLQDAVLWGLCDAASAALMYAGSDRRVTGLVILNPWVRSDVTLAKAYIRHYYAARFLDRAFWKKLFTGKVDPVTAISGLLATLKNSIFSATSSTDSSGEENAGPNTPVTAPFIDRMRNGLAAFSGPVLLILSGQDLTAAEFRDEIARSADWRRLMARPDVEQFDIAEANHTFSRRLWRDEVAERTERWMAAW